MKYLVVLVLVTGIAWLSWHCYQESKVTELNRYFETLDKKDSLEKLATLSTTKESIRKRYAKRLVKETHYLGIEAQKIMGKKSQSILTKYDFESNNIIYLSLVILTTILTFSSFFISKITNKSNNKVRAFIHNFFHHKFSDF